MLDVTDVFYLLILQFQATTHVSKMSVLQCPNQLFSRYARFLVALGSLPIIPHCTLKA